jgi:hypothetical protein
MKEGRSAVGRTPYSSQMPCAGRRLWLGFDHWQKTAVGLGACPNNVNFTDRTINGFGGDWSLPAIPIHELTETGVTFEDNQAGLYEASVVGTIEFVTGYMEAMMKLSGKTGTVENFYI